MISAMQLITFRFNSRDGMRAGMTFGTSGGISQYDADSVPPSTAAATRIRSSVRACSGTPC